MKQQIKQSRLLILSYLLDERSKKETNSERLFFIDQNQAGGIFSRFLLNGNGMFSSLFLAIGRDVTGTSRIFFITYSRNRC